MIVCDSHHHHGYYTRSSAFIPPSSEPVQLPTSANGVDENTLNQQEDQLDNIDPNHESDNNNTDNAAISNDMDEEHAPIANMEQLDDTKQTSPPQSQPESPAATPAKLTSRDLKAAIALYKQLHQENRDRDSQQVMSNLLDQDTPRTRYQKRKLLISPDAAPAQASTSRQAKRQHESRKSDTSTSNSSGNSSTETRHRRATLKKRQQRKRLFSHRVKQYKTTSLGKHKFNIQKANRAKRDA